MNAPLKFYTDYPFIKLGDKSGAKAPIREVLLLSYDGDKYCDVVVEGIEANVKAGYIYSERGRYGEVEAFNPTDYFSEDKWVMKNYAFNLIKA